MSKLITFGCSFTNYAWPTWADFFGLEFDEFENWGIPGIGNVAIANRVSEYLIKNTVTKNDIIVVQWSSHLRNDYHLFDRTPKGRNSAYNWKTRGSIFNYLNKDLYNKKWLENFFDEDSYIMLTLNAINATIALLESTECQWKMTSIGDFNKLGKDFLTMDNYGEETESKNDLWSKKHFLPYKKLWKNKNWIEPIGLYCWNRDEPLYKWDDNVDPHPSPGLAIEWVYNVLKPSLGFDNTKLLKQQSDWYYKCEEIKENVESLQMFGDVLRVELDNFERPYRGY
jgi:hypothetical protein